MILGRLRLHFGPQVGLMLLQNGGPNVYPSASFCALQTIFSNSPFSVLKSWRRGAFWRPSGCLLADSCQILGAPGGCPGQVFAYFFCFGRSCRGRCAARTPRTFKKYVKDLAKTGESKQNHLKSNVNLKAHNHKADAIGRRSLLKHGGRRSSRRMALLDLPATV